MTRPAARTAAPPRPSGDRTGRPGTLDRPVVAVLGGVAAVLLALSACTVTPDGRRADTTPAPSPTPEPPVHVAELRVPDGPAAVVAGGDAVAAALATSGALFEAAPVVVVAPADDVAAQVRGASVAVALGAPLLPSTARTAGAAGGDAEGTSATASPDDGAADEDPGEDAGTDDGLTEELARLRTVVAVTVGGVEVTWPDGVEVVPAPTADADVAAALDRDVTSGAVDEGRELAAVAALDRDAPTLLGGDPDATAGAGEAPEDTAGSDDATGGTATPGGTPSATGATTTGTGADGTGGGDDAGPALPRTALADPLDGVALLTTGAGTDLAAVATARAAGADVVVVPDGDPRATSAAVQALAGLSPTSVVGLGDAFGDDETLAWRAATAATGVELPGGGQVLFPGRRMVALYGTPTTSALGLLGEQDLPASIQRAQAVAAEYDAFTDEVVVPAFEIIVTVASAGAGPDGNYSNELPPESFVPWVEAARDAGVYVVLDLQPGRTDFLTQAKQYESLLRYPNVGLALDPEWRLAPDQVHLRQIGSVDAAEVNAVTAWLADLTRENALPQKLLVLHQFRLSMIRDRETLDLSRGEVAVMIHADGQGSQPAKQDTWRALRATVPEGIWWGWKNFIDEDVPMLTATQTWEQVQPTPELITYQ